MHEAPRAPQALVERVFRALADGNFHSGEELARGLGVTRSAVWKATKLLRQLGSAVHAVRNRGYRLASAVEPLDATLIRDALSRSTHARLRHIEVAWTVTSTNTVLLERAPPPQGECEVALAEFQRAGRGRRGRAWFAPPGGALCLSLSWTFAQVPRDVGSLSLAIGVCVGTRLDQVREETLGQVLRILLPISLLAQESVERSPVDLA